jgi:hypothetical protein
METKPFFIDGYYIWALTFEAAMKHYQMIMTAKSAQSLEQSFLLLHSKKSLQKSCQISSK